MAEALKRRLGTGLITIYGMGVMVGAGIYVLIGTVAGDAGLQAPLAFLAAGLIAAPTALSYAELSARIPEAAGEAAFVRQGFGLGWLAVAIGLAIVLSGTVSAAAVLRGGVGYLTGIIDVSAPAAIVVLGAALVLVALVGVLESLALAGLFTLIEVGGLLAVSWAGFQAPPAAEMADILTFEQVHWPGLAAAAALAFFAFIGFEDIVNLAEEARDPTHTMPRAILGALTLTTLLYALVAFAAVRAVAPEALAASDRPLVLVWEAGVFWPSDLFSGIAVIAALNGILAQVVMAARVLYGLGRRSPAFAVFHHAHPRFGTPVLATLLVGAAVIAAALTLPVADLARLTSSVLLAVFVVVNAALIALKRREPEAPFRVGLWVPVAGLLLSLAALIMLVEGWI